MLTLTLTMFNASYRPIPTCEHVQAIIDSGGIDLTQGHNIPNEDTMFLHSLVVCSSHAFTLCEKDTAIKNANILIKTTDMLIKAGVDVNMAIKYLKQKHSQPSLSKYQDDDIQYNLALLYKLQPE